MTRLGPGDALLAVDVQNDFLPGGALAVEHGDEILPILNAWIGRVVAAGLPVFASRDWHPERHCSFREQGGPWPRHCVKGSHGAEFASGLRLPANAVIVSKGTDPDRDAYSAFDGTDLDRGLRGRGVNRVVIGGLATDYCVRGTARDALSKGYRVVLLSDAVRAIDANSGDGARAIEEMLRAGATPA
jgi:nicotinamidase-related amidase